MGTDPTIVNKIKGLTGPVPVVSLYTFYMFYTAITPLQLPLKTKTRGVSAAGFVCQYMDSGHS